MGKGCQCDTRLSQPPAALLRSAWLSQGASCHQQGSRAQVGGTCLPGTSLPPAEAGSPCQSLVWCSLEDHGAVLPVEGEIGDVDGAGAAVDGRGQPVDATIRGHQYIGVESDFKRPIDAGGGKGWAQPQTVPRGQLPSPVQGDVPIALSPTCSPGQHRAAKPWWRAPAAAGCCRVPRGPTAGDNQTIAVGRGAESRVTVLPEARELVSCLSCSAPKMDSVRGIHKRGCGLRCQPSMWCHPETQM